MGCFCEKALVAAEWVIEEEIVHPLTFPARFLLAVSVSSDYFIQFWGDRQIISFRVELVHSVLGGPDFSALSWGPCLAQ